MALKSELMAVGMPREQANRLGFEPATSFTAAGTTQGTATTLTANNANVTTPSSSAAGVIVGSADQKYMIYNAGPAVLNIYPVSGGQFTGLAANISLQLAVNNAILLEGGGLTGMVWAGI